MQIVQKTWLPRFPHGHIYVFDHGEVAKQASEGIQAAKRKSASSDFSSVIVKLHFPGRRGIVTSLCIVILSHKIAHILHYQRRVTPNGMGIG